MFDAQSESARGGSWFVYLLASADCCSFKVGFSCQPLQRICTFSRRYFERFDLGRSSLLRLGSEQAAREIEALLKAELAQARAECPEWIASAAGGHTEWFGAAHLADAEARLREHGRRWGCEPPTSAFDFLMGELQRLSSSFEHWAWMQAHELSAARSAAQRGYAVRNSAESLRDWLDAYVWFGLQLFRDDPDVLRFVRACARGEV